MSFYKNITMILIWILPACLCAQPDNSGLEITYIANEGVLIEASGKKILIDAHHYRGNSPYLPVPQNTIEKMVGGFKPFDKIDLILATHVHVDHFDAENVGRHLLNNAATKFLASEQITGSIEKFFKKYSLIKKQILTVTPEVGFSDEIKVNEIPVKLLGMKHGSDRFSDIENMGYIIKLGKYKILHVGDADGKVSNFKPFHFPNEGIDVAIVPYWFLTHKPFNKIVNKNIQAGRIIAVHIPTKEMVEVEKKVLAAYPNAVVFLAPGQKMELR